MFTKNKMHMMKVREKCHLFMVLIVEKYMKQRVVVTKTHGSKGMYRRRGDHDARRGRDRVVNL